MKQINNKQISSQQGSVLIEIIITLSIVVVLITVTLNLIIGTTRLQYQNKQNNNAVLIAKEMMEITEDIKNKNWQDVYNLTGRGKFYPKENNNNWELQPGEKQENGFSSYILINEIKRDNNNKISNSGTVDQDIVEITSIVEWKSKNKEKKINLNTLMSNLQN